MLNFIVTNLSGRPRHLADLANFIRSDRFPAGSRLIVNGNLVSRRTFLNWREHDCHLAQTLQTLSTPVHQKSGTLYLIPGAYESTPALADHPSTTPVSPSATPLAHYLSLARTGLFLKLGVTLVKDYLELGDLLLIGAGYLDQLNPSTIQLKIRKNLTVITPFPPFQLIEGDRIGGYHTIDNPYLGSLRQWHSLPFDTPVDDHLILRAHNLSRALYFLGRPHFNLYFGHFDPSLSAVAPVSFNLDTLATTPAATPNSLPSTIPFNTSIPCSNPPADWIHPYISLSCAWQRPGVIISLG